jgi:hypothetical protein
MYAKFFLLILAFTTSFVIARPQGGGPGTIGPISDGVNCQGSSNAGFFDGKDIATPSEQVEFVLNLIQNIDPNRLYENGEHIGCVNGTVAIFVPVSLCFFLQETSGSVMGGDMLKLVTQLSLSCGQAGSISTGFFGGDLDLNHG